MKKNRIKLTVIVLVTSLSLFSQGKYGHVTPTTSDFIKYGEVPVSLFTGKVNLDIPIHHIKDNDFGIPISLIYTSDGFKPAKRAGIVGLDWFLNVGGVITREVYGSPDEVRPHGLGQEYGYLLTIKEKKYNKEDVWNFDDVIN